MTVSGEVELFANIKPNIVKLHGKIGEEIKTTVTIAPYDKYPFTIVGSRVEKGDNIRFNLETIKNDKDAKYLLTVENIKADVGWYSDKIFLKTNSTLKPEIEINIHGNITAPKNTASRVQK